MNLFRILLTFVFLNFGLINFLNAKPIPGSFADLAEKLMPSVVNISTTEAVGDAQQKCVVKHTIESDDPCYKVAAITFEKFFEITMTAKECICNNGKSAKNAKCPKNGESMCESCDLTYSISENEKSCKTS
jgi:S1-C subfamily serine protease